MYFFMMNKHCSDNQSCSQESALMSDGTFEQLESMTNLDGPFDDKENLTQALLQNSVANLTGYNSFTSTGKSLKTKLENEETATGKVSHYSSSELCMPVNDTYFIDSINDMVFPQKYNFVYTLGEGGGTGQDWMYSCKLHKVFIKMDKNLPLRFMGWNPNTPGLYLRTAILFKLDEYRGDPVHRCHNHMASSSINQDMDPRKIEHVVHCVSHQSEYQNKNGHLSVLTPLSGLMFEHGSQYITMVFKFLCKNSCQSGMNRRPTELLFTLENHEGKIFGTQKLLIRICSSPKRDKEKEEENSDAVSVRPNYFDRRKSKANNKSISVGSSLKSSSFDSHVYKIELNIPGKENYLAVHKYAYDLMAGQAARSGRHEFFKSYMEEILRNIP